MKHLEIKKALEVGNTVGYELFPEIENSSEWYNANQYLVELDKAKEEFLKENISALSFNLFSQFDTTGNRLLYENEYFKHRKRFVTFAMLSLIDETQEYIQELEDIIWAMCDEYTWVLPAHLGGQSKNPDNLEINQQQIDLFSAETAYALAEVITIFNEKLSPIVIERAYQLIYDRVLNPFITSKKKFGWENLSNNWASVCGGSVGATALYLIEDTEVLASVISRVVDTMECFLNGFENDGVCTEGLDYWSYGFSFFIYFSQLLKNRTAGEIDLIKLFDVENIAMFPQKIYLGENKIASFSDSMSEAKHLHGLLCFLKKIYPSIEIPNSKYQLGLFDDPVPRLAHAIHNLVWSEETSAEESYKNQSYLLETAQWFISKVKTKECGEFAFATKGGHNAEHHNHNDIGSFILYGNGDVFLEDLGAGEYTKDYFSGQRYTILCNGSQGHSVPIVDGEYQRDGREYCSSFVDSKMEKDCDMFEIELSRAYENYNLTHFSRRFELHKTERAYLLLQDKFILTLEPKEVIERFITKLAVVRENDGVLRIQGKSGYVRIYYPSELLYVNIHQDEFADHSGKLQDINIIDLIVEEQYLSTNINLKIKFELERKDN